MVTENEYFLIKAESSALLAELQNARLEISFLKRRLMEEEQKSLKESFLTRSQLPSLHKEMLEGFFTQLQTPFLIINDLTEVLQKNEAADVFFEPATYLNKVKQLHSLFNPESQKLFSKHFAKVKRSGLQTEITLDSASGKPFSLRIHSIELANFANHGLSRIYAIIATPLTSQESSSQMSHLLFSAAEQSRQGILITDEKDTIVRINHGFSEITGYLPTEAIGQKTDILLSGRHSEAFYHSLQKCLDIYGYWEGEIWHKAKSGRIYPEWLQITRFFDELYQQNFYIRISTDITLSHQENEQKTKRAFFDTVTNLPNKDFAVNYLRSLLFRSSKIKQTFAILSISFSPLEEASKDQSLTDNQENLLLQHVSQRIVSAIEWNDYAARMESNEFMVILLENDEDNRLDQVLSTLINSLKVPYDINNQQHLISTAIGASVHLLDENDANDLLWKSYKAMRHAKSLGANQYFVYEPSLED